MKRWFVMISGKHLVCVGDEVHEALWNGLWDFTNAPARDYWGFVVEGYGAIIESDTMPTVAEAQKALEGK